VNRDATSKSPQGSEPSEWTEAAQGFDAWCTTNVYEADGYVVASITVPLGDLSSWQMRELAQIARRSR
jgi:hypothetical protein